MDLDSLAEVAAADFEWFTPMVGTVEGGGSRGREGMEAYFRDSRDSWEEIWLVEEEIRDLGDSVLLLGRLEGRGRGSGASVDAPIGIVLDLRDGKISRSRGFLDHGEALRAAGLAE